MKDLGALMKQAQAMQQKLQMAQEQMARTLFEGAAGGGLVKVAITGGNDLKSVWLDDSLLQPGEGEIIADLIVAAHADAKRQLDQAQAASMKDVAGPMVGAIPGLKF